MNTTMHYVRWDEPGRRGGRAICGKWVDRYTEHSVKPTCTECARQLAADANITADDMFGTEAPGKPVHSTLSDPLAGYRPKGARS